MFDQEMYKMQCLGKDPQMIHHLLLLMMKILTPLMMILMMSYAEVSKVKTIWIPQDYMDGYYASADSVGPVIKIITKKNLTASQLDTDNEVLENTMKGLELSLSFPFDLLRRKYMEGILRNMNRQKINYQNMENMPDLETYG